MSNKIKISRNLMKIHVKAYVCRTICPVAPKPEVEESIYVVIGKEGSPYIFSEILYKDGILFTTCLSLVFVVLGILVFSSLRLLQAGFEPVMAINWSASGINWS
jgi:hypothetical protein